MPVRSAPSRMDEAGGDGRLLLTDDAQAFETRYDDEGPSVAIVRAIATVEDVPPTEVDFSLHEYVDADALDGLFLPLTPSRRRRDLAVAFPVDDYLVGVRADGRVLVERTPDEA